MKTYKIRLLPQWEGVDYDEWVKFAYLTGWQLVSEVHKNEESQIRVISHETHQIECLNISEFDEFTYAHSDSGFEFKFKRVDGLIYPFEFGVKVID